MAEKIDKEIDAIRAVLLALDPLPADIRTSVLEYVVRRLNISLHRGTSTGAAAVRDEGISASEPEDAVANQDREAKITHIKEFKDLKKPRSANEMAAIVAYYLANLAPTQERKDKITAKDVDTYFKIASFRLPKEARFTLGNAKAAGYLDAVGNGEYKLNAVGHNLVVHSMPRGAGGSARPKRKTKKKKAKRASKKK